LEIDPVVLDGVSSTDRSSSEGAVEIVVDVETVVDRGTVDVVVDWGGFDVVVGGSVVVVDGSLPPDCP
jgi:hypothetical protein